MSYALSENKSADAKIIPIVLCTDHAYCPYAHVALASIIKNRSLDKNIFYDIYIFHDEELTSEDISAFNNIKFDNLKVECKNVGYLLNEKSLYTREHYSKQMFYRWLIAKVLEKYEKVVYLDCDVIACDDVAKLYDIDLKGNVVGAVKDCVKKDKLNYYIKKELKIVNGLYVNSGVLLIDTQKFIKEDIFNKCLHLLKNHNAFAYPDQDILNIVLQNKILVIDESWNVQWRNVEEGEDVKINILHFTTGKKPWKASGVGERFADEFWKYAKGTYYYQELVNNLKSSKNKAKNNKNSRKYRFFKILLRPFRIIKKFFKSWREVGFKNSCHELSFEIRYIFHRIFGNKK